jgi:cytoskeletal protein CcmA (bactofilin family)
MQATMQPDPAPFSDLPSRYPGPSAPVDVMRERHAANTRPVAQIGKTIRIQGDVTGDEDLIIEGRVEGTIRLEKHRVTIGASGDVQADIAARSILLAGTVRGNLTAGERVEIAAGGSLTGDVRAPRLQMGEGAFINGRIETGQAAATQSRRAQGAGGT